MIRFGRRGFALMGTAVLTVATVGVGSATAASAAPAATPFGQATFMAYGTGSELHTGLLKSGATTVASVEQAFSANVAAGGGLGGAMTSPGPLGTNGTGAVVQSDQTGKGKNTYGRGSGAEVGLVTGLAQPNQIQLGLAEAAAPPTTPLVTKTAVDLNLGSLAHLGLLTGKAAAAYNPSFCPVGQPLAYGEGDASAPTTAVGNLPAPLVSGTGVSGSQAAQSRTYTTLAPNADGTYGIANAVAETIAPLTLNIGTLTVAITVQGADANHPVTYGTFDTGEGSSGFTMANADPLVTIGLSIAGVPVPGLGSLQLVHASTLGALLNPLLGPGGAISTAVAGLGITLSIGANLLTHPAGPASVAYDLVAVHAALGALSIADVRLGHFESAVSLPNGPISCTIPVNKVSSVPSVQAGNSFTWSISIPSSTAALADSACSLTGIKATDKIAVQSGSPTFTIGTISNGGTYDTATSTITWADLGTYTPGSPPIVLSVTVSVPSNSPAGVLEDTANVTASLGACNGGASGLVTSVNSVIGGSFTLVAPTVTSNGSGLATTGTGPLLAWVAAGLVLMAYATRRLVRRVDSDA